MAEPASGQHSPEERLAAKKKEINDMEALVQEHEKLIETQEAELAEKQVSAGIEATNYSTRKAEADEAKEAKVTADAAVEHHTATLAAMVTRKELLLKDARMAALELKVEQLEFDVAKYASAKAEFVKDLKARISQILSIAEGVQLAQDQKLSDILDESEAQEISLAKKRLQKSYTAVSTQTLDNTAEEINSIGQLEALVKENKVMKAKIAELESQNLKKSTEEDHENLKATVMSQIDEIAQLNKKLKVLEDTVFYNNKMMEIGLKVRARFHEFQKSRKDHTVIEKGNLASHGSYSITDIALVHKKLLSKADYVKAYGVESLTVQKLQNCSQFVELITWYGSVKSWIREERKFKMSGFAKTIPPERLAVFTNMNLPRCSYFFTNTDIKKTCAQLKFQYLLEKSKDDKLQAERRQVSRRCHNCNTFGHIAEYCDNR